MIDILIVFLYLLILPIISIHKKRTGNNFSSFSKITEKLKGNKLILVATIFASSIGGGTTFGISEKAFSENIAYGYGLIMAIPVDIAIAIYIIPRLIKHYGAESIGDIMYTYYGNAGRYISGFSSILVSVGLLAAQISVSGRIFEYILGIDYILGVVLSYGIVVIYTTIGGFQSILFTNLLQFFTIIVAIPIISLFGLYEIGLENFIDKVPPDKISFTANSELLGASVSAMLGFIMINLLPTFIQRVLINRQVQTTQTAIYIKSLIYFLFIIFVTLNGLIAFIQFPEVKANIALPYLIGSIIPHGIQGIVVVGLLAAVMSTADSDLNVLSITTVKDFFKPIFAIKEESKMLLIVRITNIILGSFAIILALSFNKIVDLVIFISGFWGAITLLPLIFGLYNIVIGKYAFIVTSISGALSFIIWSRFFETNTSLKGVFVGAMVNLVIFFIFYIKKSFYKTL